MTDGLTIHFENIEALTSAMASLSEHVQSGGKRAIYQEAEREMKISKTHVPVDKGNLRATGHVEEPMVTPEGIEVILGYGGPAAGGIDVGYALVVHEDLELHHKVGEPKYLESPMRDELGSGRASEFVGAIIAQAIES